MCSIQNMAEKFIYNNSISGYEVQFIPLERREVDRRAPARNAALPAGLAKERRRFGGRRNKGTSYSPNFMAHVAVAALRGDRTPAEVAQQYGVHPDQIANWKVWLLSWVLQIFGEFEGNAPPDKKD
jgi:hypothetical protein